MADETEVKKGALYIDESGETKVDPPFKELIQEVIDPKDKGKHPAVMAQSGHKCTVEGCPFIFGDPVYGIEPHPVQLVIHGKPIPTVEPPKPVPPPRPAPSPTACDAIGMGNTCQKCGWNSQTSIEPHPVLP